MKDAVDNLADLLFERARRTPDRLAYRFLAEDGEASDRRTWGELARRAGALAAGLTAAGAGGGRVLLLFPPGLGFVDAFLACFAAGSAAVPAYPPSSRRSLGRIARLFEDCQPAAVLSTSSVRGKLRKWWPDDSSFEAVPWLDVEAVDPNPPDDWRPAEIAGDTLAFLQYTSGSTSQPKGVMVEHANLWHNQELIRRACAHDEDSVFVSWLPLYHDLGLIGNMLQNLYVGSCCTLFAPVAFLQRPRLWLEAIGRYGATTSGGPNFAYELCLRRVPEEERAGLDLSSWRVAFNGAEPVRETTLDRFAAAFERCGFDPAALYPCYGLAEATLMVSGGRVRTRSLDTEGLLRDEAREAPADSSRSRTLVSSGAPLAGQEVAVVDPDTARSCPPTRVGEIWVRGQSVAAGYWQRPEETAVAFGARLANGEGPFLRTGDLGFLDDHGELFVTGRLKDLIILRGRNHYPQDFELSAESSSGDLRAGCSAAFSIQVEGEERLVLVCEVERRPAEEPSAVIDRVRRALSEEHEVQIHEVVLIRIGKMPKTTSGKVKRRACRELYLAGELAVVERDPQAGEAWVPAAPAVPPPELGGEAFDRLGEEGVAEDLAAYLADRAARVLRMSPRRLDIEKPLTSYGLDSLAAVELQHQLQREIGRAPALADLLGGASLRALMTNDALSPVLPEIDSSATRAGSFPLAYAQRSLWYLHQLAPESSAYNIAVALRLPPSVSETMAEGAVAELASRHPVLRSTIVEEGDEPMLRIAPALSGAPPFSVREAGADGELRSLLEDEANAPFDLASDPPFRATFFRGPEDAATLLLVVHHVALDGWSLWRVLAELRRLLAAAAAGRPPALRPASAGWAGYVSWQRELVDGPAGRRQADFWRDRQSLSGDVPELPSERSRTDAVAAPIGSPRFELPEVTSSALRALATSRDTTLYVVLLATYLVFVARFSGRLRTVVGTPFSGRSHHQFDDLVGCLFNLLPVRGDLRGDPSFVDFLSGVREEVASALDHQDYPSHLIAGAEQDGARRGPVYPVTFLFQEPPEPGLVTGGEGIWRWESGDGGLDCELFLVRRRDARADFELELVDAGGRVSGWLHHREDLFGSGSAERLAGAYLRLLEDVARDPRKSVGTLDLLGVEECASLAEFWDARPTSAQPPAGDLVDWFEARVDRSPEAVAAVYGDVPMTFGELDQRADRLAELIRRIQA